MDQNDMLDCFEGKKLYGDDMALDEIAAWYEDEKEGFAGLKGKAERSKYRYDHHGLNRRHGFRYLPKRRFSQNLGFGSKYHIVFVPKYRKKKLYGKFRKRVGEILRDLCRQRGVELLEGHLISDHIHICLSVPPKYSIAFVIGFLKGKSAVLIHRKGLGKKRVSGLPFWARGYCVSAVGLDEETIRNYIREQEKSEQEHLELEFDDES